eukprot:CAMPEP_0174707778 /NCGR_PEP_ID=MMETSP1094-20130205/10209_1 /TAXON_ID=156173 /ORGANISM="Chrysochromulina brevifilum, Strain UTEX LB 985" /LENGTH=38 /DNA_ID= /DNA_START= /DNA_END= /DNA_ORIENTATION=
MHPALGGALACAPPPAGLSPAAQAILPERGMRAALAYI